MTWLLSKLTGVFGPYILGALGVLLFAMGIWLGWMQSVTVPRLHADIAKLDAARITALADAKVAQADNKQCAVDVQAQNDAVRNTATDCHSKSDAASVAAVRAVQKPIPPPAGKSAAEINQWLASTLRPPSSS